ncbi:RF-1 domain-containing protein [Nemania sp. FL0031]|nr:RF-1 domain-containing protein [Nemania sp. FL0031]
MTTSKLLFPRLVHTYKTTICNHSIITLTSPSPLRNPIWKGTLSLNLNLPITRLFATTNNPPLRKISPNNLPPRPKPPPEEEIEESFLKGSGPGGQKINKTNSAVQLKHIPTGLVVKCQATRSRSQNRTIARQLLADKLDDMSRGDESRSSVVGKVKSKKKASSAKKSRRKYRKLDEEKAAAIGDALEDEEEIDALFYEEAPEGNEKGIDRQKATADRAMPDTRQLDIKIKS